MPASSSTIKRWKLILGSNNLDADDATLSAEELQMDAALGALYEFEHSGKFEYTLESKQGTSGKSTYNISKWLGDIRNYFPDSVVHVLQKDALKLPELQKKMMLEPEILDQTAPDIHLVAMLLQLKKHIPAKTKNTARYVINKVVEDLIERLHQKTRSALIGAINRSAKNRRPKYNEIDWNATILKNLKHYQPEFKTIIPENKIGYGRKRKDKLKDIILCLDQSASMATSVVYSGIFANVMASLPNISTKLLVFDTQIRDLSNQLDNLVDLLFGIQLGGGTDIKLALNYCQRIIEKPSDTILILISDLYEGGRSEEMQQKIYDIMASGVQIITLLSLSDDGTPSFDQENSRFMASLNIPVFACTPDMFPDMMAAAINGQDMHLWASQHEIITR
ncbi:MAG: VWA domain-containing protein [Saprospiraceae bacterium]